MEKRYAKIIERDGKQHLAFAVGGKDEAWYEKRGFKPYGGIENPPVLPRRKTLSTVPVEINGRIYCARIYADLTPLDYDNVMEGYMKRVREERGYTLREPDDHFGTRVPRWLQDAKDWCVFRDDVLLYGLKVQNEYAATGKAPTLMEFVAALPKITWNYVEGDGTEPSSVVIEEHYSEVK